MPRQINWQIVLVLLLTLTSLILVFPTGRYFTFMAKTSLPAPGTPEEKKYDEKVMELKTRSITPGLDLQGGVDILLTIDQAKTELDNISGTADRLKQSFRNDSIDATFDIDQNTRVLKIKLLNPKNYRQAKNILDLSAGVFASYDPTPLENGKPISLRLSQKMMERYSQDAIDGSEKVLRNRVDEFGLTLATVVRSGSNRIRVQIPGEKDPQRVIKNMLKPAQLEFRLVADESDEKAPLLVEKKVENGKEIYTVKTDQVPPGYHIFFGQIPDRTPGQFGGVRKTKTVPFLLKDEVALTGKYLKETYVEVMQSDLESPIHINLAFDREGARMFRDLTEKNLHKRLAVLLDGVVATAPNITEVIPNGRCFIKGSFDMEEARDISQVLKAGSMPARLAVEHEMTVGASLGTDTIKASVKALILGTVAVVALMILYYGTAGMIADIALLLNVLMILAILSLARATLTLSGIGGILLTVGMAVDANVLIYERIREEIASGKVLRTAVKKGFDRAFIVIWDSNFTTIITALILLQFAVGSVKGFALTMFIGLVVNLYTGFAVTRTITNLWVSWRNKLHLGFLRLFKNPRFDFVKARYGAYAFSGTLIILGIIGLIKYKGPIYAVDFEGGVLAHVKFTEKVSGEDIGVAFSKAGAPTVRVQRITGTNDFLLRTKLIDNNGDKTQQVITSALAGGFGAKKFEISGIQQVGNEIGAEFRVVALQSVIIASLAILIYVGFRFQFIFGIGAVVALIHDIFITFGLMTLMGRETSLDLVSALLMILGYSINDTIVIFDRIRENMRSVYGKSFAEIVNMSINQSLNRTTLTSTTTLVPMIIMYLIGGKGLQDFSLALIIGIIVGTYSSSFVATPIAYEWIKRKGFKVKEEPTQKTTYRAVEPLPDR